MDFRNTLRLKIRLKLKRGKLKSNLTCLNTTTKAWNPASKAIRITVSVMPHALEPENHVVVICVNTALFLFSVERQDERIAEMKREYHTLHERHSEVSNKSYFMFK